MNESVTDQQGSVAVHLAGSGINERGMKVKGGLCWAGWVGILREGGMRHKKNEKREAENNLRKGLQSGEGCHS
ncbi:MAG TPA: hypothetical protein VMT51_03405 [Dongiaceae bacterium]|nr:hypothetical protein [Dongiaceae bacterium]